MTKLFINPNEICKIKILGFRNTWWERRGVIPKVSFFFFWTLAPAQPAGWFDSSYYDSNNYSLEEVFKKDNDLVFRDDKIQIKPMVFFTYKTNKDTNFTFETVEEAEKFVQDLISKYDLALELVKDY